MKDCLSLLCCLLESSENGRTTPLLVKDSPVRRGYLFSIPARVIHCSQSPVCTHSEFGGPNSNPTSGVKPLQVQFAMIRDRNTADTAIWWPVCCQFISQSHQSNCSENKAAVLWSSPIFLLTLLVLLPQCRRKLWYLLLQALTFSFVVTIFFCLIHFV